MRRRVEVPLPAAGRWLLSWSDFVTLLLAMFAAMYAGASVDRAKSDALAHSVSAALGTPAATASSPVEDMATGDDAAMIAEQIAAELRKAMSVLGLEGRVQVTVDGASVGIDIGAELLFREGDAALSSGAKQMLTDIARVLRDTSGQIRVEGHTDGKPIANDRFASNWELSAARAAIVVRMLGAVGIAESRMMAVGMSANRPLASNESAEGRARNRRVHLVLIR